MHRCQFTQGPADGSPGLQNGVELDALWGGSELAVFGVVERDSG
jgi:hypothetical protein